MSYRRRRRRSRRRAGFDRLIRLLAEKGAALAEVRQELEEIKRLLEIEERPPLRPRLVLVP